MLFHNLQYKCIPYQWRGALLKSCTSIGPCDLLILWQPLGCRFNLQWASFFIFWFEMIETPYTLPYSFLFRVSRGPTVLLYQVQAGLRGPLWHFLSYQVYSIHLSYFICNCKPTFSFIINFMRFSIFVLGNIYFPYSQTWIFTALKQWLCHWYLCFKANGQ